MQSKDFMHNDSMIVKTCMGILILFNLNDSLNDKFAYFIVGLMF